MVYVIMHAIRQELLPASGVEFAASVKLTPSTLDSYVLPTPQNSTARHELAARALCNVVVARSNLLRIFEVREELAPLSQVDEERERTARVRRGTEAVEGEVEMDVQGEGFVNMGSVKVIFNNFVSLPSSLRNARFAFNLSGYVLQWMLTLSFLLLVYRSEWHLQSSNCYAILFCS